MSSSAPSKWVGLSLRLLIALGVSALALGWAFRGVDLEQILLRLGQSHGALALYTGIQLVVLAVRVLRWGLLVAPLAPLGPRPIFAAGGVGIAASFFLPLRLGELVRPIMLSRVGVPFAAVVASVVVVRIVDGLANVGMFFFFVGALPSAAGVSGELAGLSKWALLGFSLGCGGLFGAYIARSWVLARLEQMLMPRAPRVGRRLRALIENFADGLSVLQHPMRALFFLALTLAYWGLQSVSMYILAESYVPGLAWVAAPFTVAVTVFAIMIPAGPGFAGTLEAGFCFGLLPFGVSKTDALAVALAGHLAAIISLLILGFLGLIAAEPAQRQKAHGLSVGGTPSRSPAEP